MKGRGHRPGGHAGANGGDLKDGRLLCPWHHSRSHDDRYLVDEPQGDVRFHKRR